MMRWALVLYYNNAHHGSVKGRATNTSAPPRFLLRLEAHGCKITGKSDMRSENRTLLDVEGNCPDG